MVFKLPFFFPELSNSERKTIDVAGGIYGKVVTVFRSSFVWNRTDLECPNYWMCWLLSIDLPSWISGDAVLFAPVSCEW